ncbi:hypothetical protein ACFQZ4_29490 [Catellatospora coxensis]|uniref:Uncharacterized protein n=1 Tax=Catellatospora coxensis TaxID=310354 RepID=A0A8J3L0W6_9ACTN|nr:hypothetical protein [Catellatospora coxensis]GIG09922.1 hypothetical protein Cco03nite_66220 [Catellatospora coxensis]
MEIDNPGLVRYWFVFDLTEHRPPPRPEPEGGGFVMDCTPTLYGLLWRGAGVTGYDEQDCLRLLEAYAGEPLPAVERALRYPAIDPAWRGRLGNPAWRGVWYPSAELTGPVIGPALSRR